MEFEVIKMKSLKLFFYLLIANCLLFISCTSLQQDIVISSIPQDEVKELSDYEFRLVHLDAEVDQQNGGDASFFTGDAARPDQRL